MWLAHDEGEGGIACYRPRRGLATTSRRQPCPAWICHSPDFIAHCRHVRHPGAHGMTDESTYTPPKVWHWNKASGGQFASINRPIAGPTHDKELPVGRHPLQLYSLATPNGVKVTVMLEELLALGHRGAEYDAWLIRIRRRSVRQRLRRGQPELQDPGADGSQRADADPGVRIRRDPAVPRREVRRVPADRCRQHAPNACRGCSGRWAARPISAAASATSTPMRRAKIEYAIDRFAMEVKRQLDVLDRRLAENEYLAGERLHDRRHRHLALVRRTGEGLAVRRRRVPRGAGVQATCSAGPTRSPHARRCSAAAWSTGLAASPRASCTSVTTPAISRPRRRTRSASRRRRVDPARASVAS